MVLEAVTRRARWRGAALGAAVLGALAVLPASAGAADWGSRPVRIGGG